VTANRWVSIDARAIKDICTELTFSALSEHATLFNDPRWVLWHANDNDKNACIYALREGSNLVGVASFLAHPSVISIDVGRVRLLSCPVYRLDSFSAPLILSNGDRDREIFLLSALVDRLKEDTGKNAAAFFELVQEGTAMFDLLANCKLSSRKFHPVQYGQRYRHRYATIPDSLDAYLRQLGTRTRADLRTTRKRFVNQVKGRYYTRCFRSAHEVPLFLQDAMEVSRKTYQYRLYGSGLRDTESLERFYTSAAELGWFRSYILYVQDRPIAFQVAYVYRGRFHAEEIGYDPEWAQHHVGIFLHTEIITDLAASGGAITEFDFGRGDFLHKQRLSTRYRIEGYFYLLPTHMRARALAASLRATNYLSSKLGAVLEGVGVRAKVHNFIRKLEAAG
jgi:hypothetical protein